MAEAADFLGYLVSLLKSPEKEELGVFYFRSLDSLRIYVYDFETESF